MAAELRREAQINATSKFIKEHIHMNFLAGFPSQPTPKDFGLADEEDWDIPRNQVKVRAYDNALHEWHYAIRYIADAMKKPAKTISKIQCF